MNNFYFDIRRNQTRKMSNSIENVEKKKSKINFEKYTVDQAIESAGYGRFQRKLAVISGGSFGNTSLLLFYILTTISKQKEELELSNLSSLLYNQTLTVLFLGQIVGGLFWSFIGKKYGRSKAFLFSSLVTSLAVLLSSFINVYSLILISRFFIGIGLGSAITVDFQMFLEFTLISKIQFSHLTYVIYWIISGAILSNIMSWILIPIIGMKLTTLVFTIPSIIVTYFKFKWKHESPRYLVKEHKMYSAADVLYNMSEENNTKVPSGTLITNLDEQNDIANSKIESCFKYSKQLKNTIYILLNTFATLLAFTTNLLYLSSIKSSDGNSDKSNNNNNGNDTKNETSTIYLKDHFCMISILWGISSIITIPAIFFIYNKLSKYQKHMTYIGSLFVLSVFTILMAFSANIIFISTISIPILISTEICFALVYNHMLEYLIPISKSAAFSLIGYSIPTYGILIVLLESLVLDYQGGKYFLVVLILTGLLGIECNIYNIFGFKEVIEQKSENTLDELENGSLIGQNSINEYDNIECLIED